MVWKATLPLLAGCHQRFKTGRISRILHQQRVVGQQNRIEIETFQAASVEIGNLQSVAGDSQEARQTLLTRFNEGLQGAPRAKGSLPVLFIHQEMHLP